MPHDARAVPAATLRSLLLATAIGGLSAAAPLSAAHAQAADTSARQPVTITWLGHAGFELVSAGGTRILIDPWIGENAATPAAFKDTLRYAAAATRPAAILVTHAHDDHAGDVPLLARVSGAAVVGVYEHLSVMEIPGAQQRTTNVGGAVRIGDLTIHAVPAMHSSEPAGRPLGYVVRLPDGRSIYHTGDTWVFGDMALIQQFYRPAVILLNVGGVYGQDPEAAAYAVRTWFDPRVIVPMHFAGPGNPFSLASEAEVRAAFPNDPRLRFLVPGTPTEF